MLTAYLLVFFMGVRCCRGQVWHKLRSVRVFSKNCASLFFGMLVIDFYSCYCFEVRRLRIAGILVIDFYCCYCFEVRRFEEPGACIISLFLLTLFKLIYKTHFTTKLTKFILYLTLNDKNTIVLCQIATKSINFIVRLMYCFTVVLYNLYKK